jgi:hypothetical protein
MALSKLLRVMRGAVGCLWLATVEKVRPGVLPGVPPLPPTLPCSSCLPAKVSATARHTKAARKSAQRTQFLKTGHNTQDHKQQHIRAAGVHLHCHSVHNPHQALLCSWQTAGPNQGRLLHNSQLPTLV